MIDVHGEESVAIHRRGVSEGSIVSTCTEHRMLNMLHHSSIFYQLAQARPHNVLHFLVMPIVQCLLLVLVIDEA